MSDADNIPHWPDECPECYSVNIVQDPHTLSWVCGECGCDEESIQQDMVDLRVKALKEGL